VCSTLPSPLDSTATAAWGGLGSVEVRSNGIGTVQYLTLYLHYDDSLVLVA
jgi:hypothetical protein